MSVIEFIMSGIHAILALILATVVIIFTLLAIILSSPIGWMILLVGGLVFIGR